MNAPPGVDTDTSGEEFTPPPSPKADPPKPQFSLTSIFPTKRLKKLRKAKAEIMTQTPEEAVETVQEKTPTPGTKRLEKKRVRIAEIEDEPIDTSTIPTSPAETVREVVPEALGLASNVNDPSQVIALLRQMMADNASAETEDEQMESTPEHEPESTDVVSTTANDIELPTPVGASFAKRRPGGLDFSNLFRTKTRPDKKVGNGPSTAPPPGQSSNLSGTSGSTISSPTMDTTDAAPPQSAPPWLWTGSLNNPPPQAYSASQPPHTPPGNSGYPPWLWNPVAHGVDRQQIPLQQQGPMSHPMGQNQQYFNPTQAYPNNPPFPPYYPHPQSLQPWQPYYPQWPTPPHHIGDQSPYDGIANQTPGHGKTKVSLRDTTGQRTDPKPDPAGQTDKEKQSSLVQPVHSRTKAAGPKLRPPASGINTPTTTKAGSIADSIIPVHGDQDGRTLQKASSSSRRTESQDRIRSSEPGLEKVTSPPRLRDKQSIRDDTTKQNHSKSDSRHNRPSCADVGSKSPTDRHPRLDEMVRAAGLGHTPSRKAKDDAKVDTASRPSADTLKQDPTWTECLVALATSIRTIRSHMTTPPANVQA